MDSIIIEKEEELTFGRLSSPVTPAGIPLIAFLSDETNLGMMFFNPIGAAVLRSVINEYHLFVFKSRSLQ